LPVGSHIPLIGACICSGTQIDAVKASEGGPV